MRPSPSSLKSTTVPQGPGDLSTSSSNSARSLHKAQLVHSSKGVNENATNDDLMRLTQENLYLRTRLEQSKVLLRDITNAAKINSSQLELMKVYKEQHDAMSKRLTDVKAAYLADAERLQQLLAENQILQRQVGELTMINNTYCEALTGLQSTHGEMTETYTKAVISNPTLSLSTDCMALKKDVQKQLLAGIESSLMHLISKHNPSSTKAGREVSKSVKSRSNSTINNPQTKSDRWAVRSRSRNSSNGASKKKDSGKVTKTASGGTKRARSTGSGIASTKANLDQVTKLICKEVDTPQQNVEPRPSLSEYPYRNFFHVPSDLEGSKAPDNSFTARDVSTIESGRCTPSLSTKGAQSNQSTPGMSNPQARRSNTLSDTPQGHDIYRSIDNVTLVSVNTSECQPTDISLTSLANERTDLTEQKPHQGAVAPGHISEFYRQHIRTVTEPLLQSIAGLEHDNETLQAVVESKDKEISVLKEMLAKLYGKPEGMQPNSIALTFSESSSNMAGSTEYSNHLSNGSTSYSHADKGLKSMGSIGICTGSGLNTSNNSLQCKDLNIFKDVLSSSSPRKEYKVASSEDYAVLSDVERVRSILQDVEKMQQQIVSETPNF
ncbi:Hypothetical protein GLP15_3755 [Giardia lamblia P15]|uniref:Uncharacterized protein n=1 Tax=Giardia intestinalis (strain P15) TaxID=658858 RepID=E1F283_GIAIA|nr:Hypothetical protein GLP15_3755 [Giardia lamblia P15]